MHVVPQGETEVGGTNLASAWTFFLGCVFLIAGLTHSIIPWMVQMAPQLGLGFDHLPDLLRSLAVHVRSAAVIVGLSAAATAIHALGGLQAIVGKFRH